MLLVDSRSLSPHFSHGIPACPFEQTKTSKAQTPRSRILPSQISLTTSRSYFSHSSPALSAAIGLACLCPACREFDISTTSPAAPPFPLLQLRPLRPGRRLVSAYCLYRNPSALSASSPCFFRLAYHKRRLVRACHRRVRSGPFVSVDDHCASLSLLGASIFIELHATHAPVDRTTGCTLDTSWIVVFEMRQTLDTASHSPLKSYAA
jgi:hypothetical protein